MNERITIINIIVSNKESTAQVNNILHEFSEHIVARMGVPYTAKDVAVICVIANISTKNASALSGKLGMLDGVTAKTMTAKI